VKILYLPELFNLAKETTLKNGSAIPFIYFLNLSLLHVAGDLPSVMAASLSLAGVLFSTTGSSLSIATCTRTFKFL
jgi:hypothetical protein